MLPGDVVRITGVPYARTENTIEAVGPSAVPRAMYPHLRHVPWWRNDLPFRLSNLKVPDDRLTTAMKDTMMKNQVGDALRYIPLVMKLVEQGIPFDNCVKYVMDANKNGSVKFNHKERIELERDVHDCGYIVTGPLRVQKHTHHNGRRSQRSKKQHQGHGVYRDVPLLDRTAAHRLKLSKYLSSSSHNHNHEKVCAYVHGRGIVVVNDVRKVEVRLRQSPSVLCYIAAMMLDSAGDDHSLPVSDNDQISSHNPPPPPPPDIEVGQGQIDSVNAETSWQFEKVDSAMDRVYSASDEDDEYEVHNDDDTFPSIIQQGVEGTATSLPNTTTCGAEEVLLPIIISTAPVKKNKVRRLQLPAFGTSIATAARQARIRAHLIQSLLHGSTNTTADHVHPLLQHTQSRTSHVAESAEIEEGANIGDDVLYQLIAPMAVRVVQGRGVEDGSWRRNAIDNYSNTAGHNNRSPLPSNNRSPLPSMLHNRSRLLHTGLSQMIDWLQQEPPTHTPGTWGDLAASFVEPYLARPGGVLDPANQPVMGREGYAIAAFPHAVQHGEYVWLVRLLAEGETFDSVGTTTEGGCSASEYCICATSEVYRRKVQPTIPTTDPQHLVSHETLREAMLLVNKPQHDPSPTNSGILPYFSNPSSRHRQGASSTKASAFERELAAEFPTNNHNDDVAIILQGCWVPQCYPSSYTRRDTATSIDETNNDPHYPPDRHDEPFYEDIVPLQTNDRNMNNEDGDEVQQHQDDSAANYVKRDREVFTEEAVGDANNQHHHRGGATAVEVRMAAMLKEDNSSDSDDEDEKDFNTMHHLLNSLTVGDELSLQDRVRNRCRDLTERLDTITQPKDNDVRLGFHGGDPRLKESSEVCDNVDMFQEVQEGDFTATTMGYDPLDIVYPTGCEFRMGGGDESKREETGWEYVTPTGVAEEEEW